MALNQRVLQHQGFKLAGDENCVKVVNLRYHLAGFDRVGCAVLKVLADPVFQFLRLAHINDLAHLIHHKIDSWRQGEIGSLFL